VRVIEVCSVYFKIIAVEVDAEVVILKPLSASIIKSGDVHIVSSSNTRGLPSPYHVGRVIISLPP